MIKKIDTGEKIIITRDNESDEIIITYSPSFTTKENIKIKQAVLELPLVVKNSNIKYEVDQVLPDKLIVIDQFQNASQENKVCIDISDEVQEILNNDEPSLILKIKDSVEKNITFSNDARVLVYYFDKRDDLKSSSYEVDCKRAGKGKVNLSTGAFSFVHNDLVSNQNALPIKINHVYNSFLANKDNDTVEFEDKIVSLPSFNCGKGWKLNVQQYLVKEKKANSLMSDGESASKFTYINAEGKHEEFLEKYQYIDDDGNPHYITASEVHIDLDGNLKFLDSKGVYRPVEQKLITNSGLTLSARYEDFSGLSFIEQDVEEVANLKSEIESLHMTIDDINNNINSYNSNLQLAEESFDISEENQELQKLSLDNEELTLDNEVALKEKKLEYTTQYRRYRNELDNRTFKNVGEDNQPTATEKNAKYLYDSASDYIEDANTILTDQLLTNRREILNRNKLLTNKNAEYLDHQNESQVLNINNNLKSLNTQLNKYNKLLKQKEHQLLLLEKQVPVHYMTNEDGIVFGFGKTNNSNIFRLIIIADNYENAIYITYDDNKIKQIQTSDSNKILFNYNNDKLDSIIDTKNRKTMFKYLDDFLSYIIYPNSQTSSFNYSDENLISITEPSGYGTSLAYDNNKRIIGIDEITKTTLITKNNKVDSPTPIINNSISIDYYDIRSTILKNNKTNKVVTYVFDTMGNVTTIYENKFETENSIGNVRVTSYDIANDKKTFKISSIEKSEDLLKGIAFIDNPLAEPSESYLGDDFLCGSDNYLVVTKVKSTPILDSNVYKIDATKNNSNHLIKVLSEAKIEEIRNSKITDFILSGWAKADSSWVNRRCTDYSNNEELNNTLDYGEINKLLVNNMDTLKINRRFELRATLTYVNNGIKKVVEQYCSFDWMNTNWQYCAFPVTLSEDPEDMLDGLELIFDYSNNTNTAEFYGMSLKEGQWEYSEYNDDNLKTYYENSHTNIITTYEYEGKKLIKELKIKDSLEYPITYEYDSNGALKRVINFDGIINENEYNDKGTLIKSYTYHKTEPSCKIYSEEKILDDHGNNKIELNNFGEEIAENSYLEGSEVIKSKTLKNGRSIAYGYDKDDDTLLSASVNMDDESNTNIYGYNFNMLTSLSHNNFDYEFEYDGLGRQTKIDIAEQNYQIVEYDQHTTTLTLATNEKFIKTFNDDGNLLKLEYVDKSGERKIVVENIYDTYGTLLRTNDYSNENETIQYNVEYDKYGNINKKYYIQNFKNITIESITNSDENKINETISIGENIHSTKYKYNKDPNARLNQIKFSENISQNISYDNFGRVKQTKLSNILTKNYSYLQKGDHSSNLIACEWFGNNKVLKDSLKYSYDKFGNISIIKENGIEIVRYAYDDLSRLIREDNKKLNKTITYSYDKGGNITEYYVYPYSTIETSKLLNGTKFAYSYPVDGWRDKLLSFNGEVCEYDEIGNPTIYRNKHLTWQFGRQLTNFEEFEYKYNAEGIRTSKTISGKTTHYYLDGTKLLAQDDGNLLSFMYGVDGVIGFNYEGVGEFIYKKNIFGDIIGIFDKNGQEIVKYSYDAWGNHKTCVLNDGAYVDISNHLSYTQDGLNNKLIADINPFRYRGYYYDIETHLYYLNSRYYDPEVGRFINADRISILGESKDYFNGLNLFAYCNNNPISNVDESGEAWWHWLIGALIIVVAAVLTVVTAGGFAAAGAAFAGVLGIGGATAVGGAAGLFAGITIGAAISGAIGFISGGISSLINGESFLDGASKGFMWGSILGAISGGFGTLGFGGAGNLYNAYTGEAVGNIFQIIGQSVISFGTYIARSLVENEQITIIGSLFSLASGFTGGLLSHVPYQTQLIVSILWELENVAIEALKRVVNIPKNIII